MMDSETWFSAKKAIEFGFADAMMFDNTPEDDGEKIEPFTWNRHSMVTAVVNAMHKKLPKKQTEQKPTGTPIDSLEKRLSLIIH